MILKSVSFKIIIAFCFITFQTILGNPCKIHVRNDINSTSPMVLKVPDAGESLEYMYPSSSWKDTSGKKDYAHIVIPEEGKVLFVCPPRVNRLSRSVEKQGTMVIPGMALKSDVMMKPAKCVGDLTFEILVEKAKNDKYEKVKFNETKCIYEKGKNYAGIIRNTHQNCSTGQIYNIGFDLGSYGFLKTIELCHDAYNATNLWAHAVLVPENQDEYRYSVHDSNSFKTGGLYTNLNTAVKEALEQSVPRIPYDGPYSKIAERKAVELLLGITPQKAGQYIDDSKTSTKYLAKGHLVANGDKFYQTEQKSTYFFANVLPMWQTINANPGYWFTVEKKVRHIALKTGHNIDIWAGGIGVLELENKPFYLNPAAVVTNPHNKNNKHSAGVNKIPVPKVLFKIAVDKKSRKALVFLVVNDPKADADTVAKPNSGYVVCETYDVCRQKLLRNNNRVENGYLYCCKLSDFYKEHGENLGLTKEFEKYKEYKEFNLN